MLKKLISTRTAAYNGKVGCYLAFVAGAVNAGGFLAIGSYTSHMTGIAAQMADSLFLKNYPIVIAAIFSILIFMLGGITSTVLINIGKLMRMKAHYAFVLLLEGLFILAFGILATYYSNEKPLILYTLCFIMGLQNATMSKISNAQIRTTHITGMVTDISIELGKVFAKLILPRRAHYQIHINHRNLRLYSVTLLTFIFGGICGAFGFGVYGYLYVIPLSIILLVIATPVLYYDFRVRRRLKRIRIMQKKIESVGWLK
jgi:uncharacterized membrane protein YoaK (UPF0700 family)